MKSIARLQQDTLLRDAALLLLAGACMTLAGCETTSMRSDLAPPPPAFEVGELKEVYTVVRQDDVAQIEPAAGNAATVIKTSAAPSKCLQIGMKEDDELYYQWGDNRLGFDVGTYNGGDRVDDFSEATVRYSFSLQKNAPDRACRDDLASERFRNFLATAGH